jgi:O-antigen/teichoic acid export membrane protein
MLSLFELGIGSAIIYNLYKPIANNDTESIKSLVRFYKKSYNIVILVMFIVGMLVIPFIPLIASTKLPVNIYLIYLLYLIYTLSSYFIAYKRSLIIANQRNYINNIIHMIYTIILNISQLVILFLTKNYYLYLLIKIVCVFLENIITGLIANKMYPYLLDKEVKEISKKIKDDIISKVKALFIHKLSAVVKYGTDSIIISIFFGLTMVGIYTNYYYIIYSVNTIFSGIVSSVSASVGNLLVEKDLDKRYLIFRRINFLNFFISIFTSTCILVLTQDFIKIWVGEKYLLTFITLVVLVINFYQIMMRTSYLTFKDAAGIWVEDRIVPVLEIVLNITFSIVFLKLFGIVGIFLGTIISSISVWFYSYPKFVYKKIFNKDLGTYIKDNLIQLISFIIIITSSYFISSLFASSNLYIELLVRGLITLGVIVVLFILMFFKTQEFKYYKKLIFKK